MSLHLHAYEMTIISCAGLISSFGVVALRIYFLVTSSDETVEGRMYVPKPRHILIQPLNYPASHVFRLGCLFDGHHSTSRAVIEYATVALKVWMSSPHQISNSSYVSARPYPAFTVSVMFEQVSKSVLLLN